MNLIEILKLQGLNDKEARVYIALLEINKGAVSTIARKANVKRPTAYIILEQLKKRGLVSHFRKKENTYFQASNPSAFLKEQLHKYETLQNAIPELNSLHKKYSVTPQMSVYEGKEGLIQIMEDTLTTSTELLCWADIQTAVHTILENYYPTYIAKKVQNNIYLRGIFTYDAGALDFKKRGEEELRKVYLIPKEKFPFKNEINIYDDKVAIISHQDKVGVIIQNQNIADTQRAIFELGFEYAKLLERDLLTDEDKEYLGMPSKNTATKPVKHIVVKDSDNS